MTGQNISIDNNQIINNANAFYLAGVRCLEVRITDTNTLEFLPCPAIVLLSFSIELSFKSILAKDKKIPKCHDLSSLFTQLPIEYQEKISSSLNVPKEKLITRLSEISNSFEIWRYCYEYESLIMDLNFLTNFSRNMISIIKSI